MFGILAGLVAMGGLAVLVGASSCRILAAQSSCSQRSSSACMSSSTEVAVKGRNFGWVQNFAPLFKSSGCETSWVRRECSQESLKWNCVNSRSRGFGIDCGRLISGSRWDGRRIMAARAQDRQDESESGVSWMNRGTPYSVLGVSPDCSVDDIKVAFRNRVWSCVD